jgi:hypothetical protein
MKKLLIALAFLPAFLFAQSETGGAPGFHTHDGFFLSMCIGPTVGEIIGEVEYGNATDKWEINGSSMTIDFKIGGAPVENLILSGDLLLRTILGPTFVLNGINLGEAEAVTVYDNLIGFGITYYVMPANLLFSGTIGISQFVLEHEQWNIKGETEQGFGLQLKFGKEWWVSKNWGLGISGAYGFSSGSAEDANLKSTVTAHKLSVMFNTTFN